MDGFQFRSDLGVEFRSRPSLPEVVSGLGSIWASDGALASNDLASGGTRAAHRNSRINLADAPWQENDHGFCASSDRFGRSAVRGFSLATSLHVSHLARHYPPQLSACATALGPCRRGVLAPTRV